MREEKWSNSNKRREVEKKREELKGKVLLNLMKEDKVYEVGMGKGKSL